MDLDDGEVNGHTDNDKITSSAPNIALHSATPTNTAIPSLKSVYFFNNTFLSL